MMISLRKWSFTTNIWNTLTTSTIKFCKPRNKMWKYLLLTALTFFLLTPGVVLTLPPGSSRTTVAATHAVLFALVHKAVHVYLGRFLR